MRRSVSWTSILDENGAAAAPSASVMGAVIVASMKAIEQQRILRCSENLARLAGKTRATAFVLRIFRKRGLRLDFAQWKMFAAFVIVVLAIVVLPVTQLARDLLAGSLNQGRELAQTSDRHTDNGRSNAQAGIHEAGMIPDWRSYATNVKFVLFEIAAVTILADALQLNFQFLQASDCIGSETLQFKLGQKPSALIFRHVGQYDLANGGAVKGNGGPDARKNPQLFGGIELFDINRGGAVTHGEMHSFAGLPI